MCPSDSTRFDPRVGRNNVLILSLSRKKKQLNRNGKCPPPSVAAIAAFGTLFPFVCVGGGERERKLTGPYRLTLKNVHGGVGVVSVS